MIYSIGHGGQTVETFTHLLTSNTVTKLIDVRSKPFSRWQPWASQKNLAQTLRLASIEYTWEPRLGGLNGNVIQEEDLDWLVLEGAAADVAILCSEGNPLDCHRHSEIAGRLWMRQPAVSVIHLLKGGLKRPAFGEGGLEEHAPAMNSAAKAEAPPAESPLTRVGSQMPLL